MRAVASKLTGLTVVVVAAMAFVFVPGSAGFSTAVTLVYPSTGACAQSSTGLNACIASAADGDTIMIKPGTYYEHNTAVGHSVTVTGSCANPSSVVIDQGTAGDGFDVGAPNVTIECLKVRFGGSSYYGIFNPAYNGLHVSKVIAHEEYYAVFQTGSASGLSITGSTFLGMDEYALYASTVSNATLTGNTFGQTDSDCAYFASLSSSTVSNNTFVTCGSEGLEMDGGTTNTISGNQMTTGESDCFYIESAATTVTKNTVNGCDGTALYVDANTPTITSNVFNGKIDGDTIEVSCGNGVTISGNIATGGNDDDPFITVSQCSSTTETITNNTEMTGLVSYGVECSTCDNATVTGNKILGGGEDEGVYVVGLNPKVNTNTVGGGWDGEGFYVDCTGTCTNAQVESNVESGSNDDYGFYVSNSGCGSVPCTVISGNTSTGNIEDGFYLTTSYANITGNKATNNGYSNTGCNSNYSGFDVEASQNHLSSNTASGNACDGFYVNGSDTTLSTNTATGNFVHGFQIEDVSNSLDHNVSTGNFGDGFNNDGTDTVFTNNKASGNRQDCTNDSGELATVFTNTGNTCADHTNFGVDSTLTGW